MDAILIAGPTASGKSALAAALAERHGGVVVNADSMQVYDTLRVLTARPSEAECRRVEHRLYGHVAAGRHYSTGMWLRDAADLLAELRERRRIPVFVGGTGLYFRALAGGLSDMPAIPADVRAAWRGRLAEEGAAALYAELDRRDAKAAAVLRPSDGQRIVRALEVVDATGRSIVDLWDRRGAALIEGARARKIVLMPERAELHARIADRFAGMIGEGAIEEVGALLALGLDPALPIMKAIGVRQLQGVIENKFSVAEATRSAVASSRQYAKRQMTWFRNQLGDDWTRYPTASAALSA